jgi:hypothetical protein
MIAVCDHLLAERPSDGHMAEKFITAKIWKQLLKNGERPDEDRPPVVRLYDPKGPGVWLLDHVKAHAPDQAYGLIELGTGLPELGYVSLEVLGEMRGGRIVRDQRFRTEKGLAQVAAEARAARRILLDE